MNEAPAIVARGLTRRFGSVTAVDGLDLEVPHGRIYGFLGPNGSGKTTTIRMLCGLLRPSAGSTAVLGLELPRDAERLRPRIGYMTQRFALYADLTVRENLEFVAEIFTVPVPDRAARITDHIARFHLERLAGQRSDTLSGGQRQRLALAAATLHDPELLLLDEPTSAVDPRSRRDFWEFLFELADAGTTILVSTHFMDEAERCHGLAILDRGVLAAEGSPRGLMENVDAAVVEIEADAPRRAHAVLEHTPGIQSVAQLGARLHALLDPGAADPLELVDSALAAEGVDARARRVPASLEDVFVAATRERFEEAAR
jgi:ABC-2 type transport system ATP-binding protein